MFDRIIWSVLLILIITSQSGVYSQYPSLDNQRKILNQQKEELINLTDYIFGKDIRLVNGRIYSQQHIKAYGNPFMKSTDWMRGTVNVNGKNFSNVKLNYDIYQDYLIYLDESQEGYNKILLLSKSQVTKFTVEDHTFIALKPAVINNIPESQYFEILYEGKVSLFNRWTRKFEASTTQEFPNGRFLDIKISRYLLRNNELQKVNNKLALLKICEDRKDDLRKYIRKNRIHIRKASDEQLASLIEYYNRIISE